MSLVGRLEDLGLGEILQIVALSGKSGILHITSKKREGKIYFYKGKVVTAYSDAYKVNLGELLVHKGYITPEILEKALDFQNKTDKKAKLGAILINHFNIPKEKIEECVTELIEKAVFSLFYWLEGEFRFELTDDIVEDQLCVDLLQYDLTKSRGLNPQFLAMEGSRLLDEGQLENVIKESEQIKPIVIEKEEKEAAKAIEPYLLYIDDNPFFLNLFQKTLEKKFKIEVANGIEKGFEAYKRLKNEDKNPFVLVSLYMRKPDGSGILGGFDLVQRIYDEGYRRLIVVSEYALPEIEEKLKLLNINVIKKPKRSEITKENVAEQVDFFIKTLQATLKEFDDSNIDTSISQWDKEIKDEFEIEENKSNIVTTPGLTILKSMIAELSQVSTGNEIILLILRLASEIMPRGVLLAVKTNTLHGLGQFGLEGFIDQPQKTVRNLVLPLKGFFNDIANNNLPFKSTPPQNDEVYQLFLERIGGKIPTEIFLAPIISSGKTVAIFYGDNLPEKEPIRDTDALEIFLTQAGLTMERLLLEKKAKEEQN
jgi:CheY-like chemotaxis protein